MKATKPHFHNYEIQEPIQRNIEASTNINQRITFNEHLANAGIIQQFSDSDALTNDKLWAFETTKSIKININF